MGRIDMVVNQQSEEKKQERAKAQYYKKLKTKKRLTLGATHNRVRVWEKDGGGLVPHREKK